MAGTGQPNAVTQPTPEHFMETISAYQRTAALKAAIDLNLFTAIVDGNPTPAALATRCGASERGMRILCDYLVTIGFLAKMGNAYALSADSAVFLNKHSPAYLGSVANFLAAGSLMEAFQDAAAAVRKGGTVMGEAGSMAPEHPMWVDFARAMAPMMAMPAQLIAAKFGAAGGRGWKILDIAAGHGVFGISLAQQAPESVVVAVDWPNVLKVARENAAAAGLSDRYRTLEGSAFEMDFGSGYDIALITNFLHHFDPPTCVTLLKKVHAALKPGGRAITLEFVPNPDRVTPPQLAAFSFVMLNTTAAGDAYTFAEFEQMFRRAGFENNEMQELGPGMERIIVSTK